MSTTSSASLETQKYPIGRFAMPATASAGERRQWIAAIAALPAEVRAATSGLRPEQWETPYRDGGWTVRQVAHHLADSHMNAFVRCKLALTQDRPLINAYDQSAWAETADTHGAGETSLRLLDALHERWTRLLESLTPADFARTYRHPERGETTLEATLALYAWHGRHHTGHILALRRQRGW